MDIFAEMLKASAPPKEGPKMRPNEKITSQAIKNAFDATFFGPPPMKKTPKMKYVGEMIAQQDSEAMRKIPKQVEFIHLALQQILTSSHQ